MLGPRRAALLCCGALGLLRVCGSTRLSLDNGVASALLDGESGLLGLGEAGGARLALAGDSWSLRADGRRLGPRSGCDLAGTTRTGAASASMAFACGDHRVEVAYSVPPGAVFVEKRIGVSSAQSIRLAGAALFDGLEVALDEPSAGRPDWHLQANPFGRGPPQPLEIAGFIRWGDAGHGAFVSVANPWGTHAASAASVPSGLRVGASYNATYTHDVALQGRWLWTEPAVLGLTALTRFYNEGLNTGERVAFMRCVESYHLDAGSRSERTVKVNVAWDENDYQIDVGTSAGRAEYKRIIDRNAEFGVTHLVYEPQNSLHSSRFNATDGWGWEEALWFSMGERLREGKWDPRSDEIPEDVLEMVRYAGDRGVKLLAYVYPCLRFKAMQQYFTKMGLNSLSLAPPQVQAYLIDVMSAFLNKSGAHGFAWDHDIFSGDASLHYAEWRAWMHILATLRERFPEMVMDHRYSNHRWGPWYQLAGSYAEPIAGDENPEHYGVPIPSLHTDHVAADNARKINYIYSTQQLLPQSRVPGFVFHQSERTDDDGHYYCSSGEKLCVNNSNTRDFDLLGYRYSLLSTVGTAGLNNVLAMVPARDVAEFALLPAEDVAFVQRWLRWTDANIENLRRAQWIPTLPGPRPGSVDGTHAMAGDEGFIFLFNPNMAEMSATLSVDEGVGLSNASAGAEWDVTELFPREGVLVATWRHGEQARVLLGGSGARVLELRKRTGLAPRTARLPDAGRLGGALGASAAGFELRSAVGPAGTEVLARVRLDAPGGVAVNGVRCGAWAAGEVTVAARFAGGSAQRAMPVSPDRPPADFVGGWFNTTFRVPAAVKAQLRARDLRYPVPWTRSAQGCGLPHCVDDSQATWLIPSRLLLQPFLTQPRDDMDIKLFINSGEVALSLSYNSRGLRRNQSSKCFLGFYYDASDLVADTPYQVAVHLPPVGRGSFQGLFWENVETEWSSEVVSCRLVSREHASLLALYV